MIQALQSMAVRTVAVDCDAMSAGLLLADAAYTVPRYSDPTYLDRLMQVIESEACDGIVSTMSEELVVLAGEQQRFDDASIATWFPPADAVSTCIDKWQFALAMAQAGVAAPSTALGEAGEVPGPWVVKPRFGRGSQHVYRTDKPHLLSALLELCPEPIVQSHLPGREFTADCLVGRDGHLHAVVARWRSETRGGISTKGTTFSDPRVDTLVAEVVAALGLHGCCNVQGFVDTDGPARIVEVNPRFSGALPLSLASGADLVGQYVAGMYGETIDPERLRSRPEVSMVRYFADLIVGPSAA